MFKRPSPNDTEEDLLQFQKEYLASKTQPSVKVLRPDESTKNEGAGLLDNNAIAMTVPPDRDIVTLGDPSKYASTSASVPPRKKSRFKNTKRAKFSKDVDNIPVQDAEVEMEQADTHISKVLADIVERDLESTPVYYPQNAAFGGFPKVLHRGNITPSPVEKGGKKKSLFAQQFAKSSAKEFGLPQGEQIRVPVEKRQSVDLKVSTGTKASFATSTKTSVIVSGSGLNPGQAPDEAQQIHMENISQLEGMAQSDILAEQKQLLETLDPNLVAFLRRKSQPVKPASSVETPSVPQTEQLEPTDTELDPMDISTHTGSDLATSAVEPSKEWVHMDKVEPEKIEWMKDLPDPTPADTKTGKPARFDFHGKLVAMDAPLPTHLGLHHHGDEPERAGYTIAELFHLARSAHMQQRTLAINTLAKIIRNARQGGFTGFISTALIPAMVEGGLVFIIRWALDDKTENTMAAAVNILHALLVSTHDESGLDEVFCWHRGHEVSCMSPVSEETQDEQEKLSDPDQLKQDMIKGMLQMSILARLRYILEVWRPGSTVVIQVLDILIRFCRHSAYVAYVVLKSPRLMTTVFKEFLPWKIPEIWPEPLFSVYGLPCSRALKLIRVLCTSSKNIASHLICNYPVMDNIMLYMSQAQHQRWELHSETHDIILESLRTWTICIAYGLAVTHYHEHYTMLIELLQRTCQLSYKSYTQSTQLGVSLINLLQSVLHTAATSSVLTLKNVQSRTEVGTEIVHTENVVVPDIYWSHVEGLYQPIHLCLHQTADQFSQFYFDERQDISLAASCLSFMASWFGRVQSITSHNAIETLEQIEMLCEKCLIPVLKSRSFDLVLTNMRKCSVILCPETSTKLEYLTNLPELGSLIGEKMSPCPMLHSDSSMNFILAFVRVLDALKIHKGMAEKIYPMLLNNTELIQYMRQICKAKRSTLVNNHFAQFENRLQQLLINVATFPGINIDASLYHHVALYVLTHIHSGSELDIHQLLSTALFNPTLWGDLNTTLDPSIADGIDDKLKLNPTANIISATEHEITVDKQYLRTDVLSNLVSVRNTYLVAFGGSQKALQLSRDRSDTSCSFPETFMLGVCGQLVVPVDWVFLPLVEIYNSTCDITSQNTGEQSVSKATASAVTNCLRYVYCVEAYRPGCLDTVPYSLRLSRLVCTFLAGTDLFLDRSVQAYLAALLHVYSTPVALDRMNFSEPIPGLASFYDLYVILLEQYGAVSFGDSVFGSYILLPIQQRHALIFRKAIWSEYSDAIRSLHIPINQVLIPLERFLEPEETNLELLRLYYQALVTQTVTSRRTPLPYIIAVHHVNRFMYSKHHQHTTISHGMVKNILQTKDKTLQHHLLYYKHVEKDREFGISLYTDLPSSRQKLLDSFL